MPKYTKEQTKELELNKYVESCSEKYIKFTQEFKHLVLKLNKSWMFHRDIFKTLWFPEYIINSRIPKLSLDRWKNKMKHKWKEWFDDIKKWRKKAEENPQKMSKDEYIEYLEMKLEIFEELKNMTDKYP